ncbi:hypothetical protein [Sphaerisporangium sp. TRM90804]|nr:hypothetical protein [Sphaerisporangium sp. TRM90804]MDH2430640.1 hypothetical protein [Sphaerisporangium sp. TRM90804]
MAEQPPDGDRAGGLQSFDGGLECVLDGLAARLPATGGPAG